MKFRKLNILQKKWIKKIIEFIKQKKMKIFSIVTLTSIIACYPNIVKIYTDIKSYFIKDYPIKESDPTIDSYVEGLDESDSKSQYFLKTDYPEIDSEIFDKITNDRYEGGIVLRYKFQNTKDDQIPLTSLRLDIDEYEPINMFDLSFVSQKTGNGFNIDVVNLGYGQTNQLQYDLVGNNDQESSLLKEWFSEENLNLKNIDLNPGESKQLFHLQYNETSETYHNMTKNKEVGKSYLNVHYYGDGVDRIYMSEYSLTKLSDGSFYTFTGGRGSAGYETSIKYYLNDMNHKSITKTLNFNEVLTSHNLESYVIYLFPEYPCKFDLKITYNFGNFGSKVYQYDDILINVPKFQMIYNNINNLKSYKNIDTYNSINSDYTIK